MNPYLIGGDDNARRYGNVVVETQASLQKTNAKTTTKTNATTTTIPYLKGVPVNGNLMLSTVIAIGLLANPVSAQLTTDKEKFSYSVGCSIAQGLLQDELNVDLDVLLMAIRDVLSGGPMKMTPEEITAAVEKQQELIQMERQKMAEENIKVGVEFLAANKAKPDVVSHESGLQYKVIKEGTGPKPTLEDTVTVHYRGTLIDGKEFDSSYSRNEPISFQLRGLIKGWQIAIPLMPQGSTWALYLPSDLAYGMRGAGADIGPGATLIFEIELLEVK